MFNAGLDIKKIAHPSDVLTWTFPPEMFDFGLSSDDDDEGDLDKDMDTYVHRFSHEYEDL